MPHSLLETLHAFLRAEISYVITWGIPSNQINLLLTEFEKVTGNILAMLQCCYIMACVHFKNYFLLRSRPTPSGLFHSEINFRDCESIRPGVSNFSADVPAPHVIQHIQCTTNN